MQTKITLPAIPEIGKAATDSFLLCDMPGFIEACGFAKGDNHTSTWFGNQSRAQALEFAAKGDLANVPASEKMLAELEQHTFVSKRYKTVYDVVGSFPSVPALLAGVPTHMRRRVKQVDSAAPLAVFVDLTSSGGVPAENVRRRGCAILALVRLLSNLRPVEVWAFSGLGDGNGRTAAYVAVRLETAPLDLARAAHMLTSVAVSRGLQYRAIKEHLHMHGGDWPYANIELQRKHGAKIMQRAVSAGSDVLFIPPVHKTDKAITQPTVWIADMLRQYGGQTVVQDE